VFSLEEIYCLICPKEGEKKEFMLASITAFPYNHIKGHGAKANPISVL
jgi:hypothetical protein